MLDFFIAHAAKIFSAATPFILWLLNRVFQPQARLYRQVRHRFTYLIQQPLIAPDGKVVSPTQTVNTESVQIFNAGRSAATKLEIVFNWKPENINIWPSRHFEEKLSPDGRYHMFFDALPAKDIVGFELLNINSALPEMVTVRSEQCIATNMVLVPQPMPAKWKIAAILYLMAAGLAVTVYATIWLLQILITSR
ncbi:hypothetical protein ABIF90_000143 [Bradyrhizobium japonicum]